MSETLKPPLERLAEHLAARPFLTGDGGNIAGVADWLDYSLNRCGLVVVPEQSLTRPTPGEDKPLGIEEVVGILHARLKQAEREFEAGRPILAATAIKLALREVEAYEQARASTGEQP
jgi:hypothetical protein